MSVFKSLAEEHGLLRALGRRLRLTLDGREERGTPREARNILLVLLQALAGHERFEDRVFAKPFAASAAATNALAVLARQHAAISELRAEAEALLQEGAETDLRVLRAPAERLIRMLEEHFEEEERDLWPQLNAIDDRGARERADREAAERLEELERELMSYWSAVGEYLTRDP